MIAQTLALQAPERVERLVLMDTTHAPVEGVDREMADLGVAIARSEGMDTLADAMAAHRQPADHRSRCPRPGGATRLRRVRGAEAACVLARHVRGDGAARCSSRPIGSTRSAR